MIEQPEESHNPTHDRYTWRTRFFSRLDRLKNLLSSRWWLPALGAMLGLIAGALYWHFEKPVYVSFGRLIVSMKLALPESSVYTEELNNFLGTQMALMQSSVVVNRAHARLAERFPELSGQPVPLKAVVQPRTTIFVLQAAGDDPKYTQAFLNVAMDEYINLKREMRTQTSDTTLAGLTEEVLRLEKELRKCDQDLVEFQTSNSVVLLQEQGNSAGNYLATLNQRLAALKSEFDLLQTLTLEQDLERRQQTLSTLPASAELLNPAVRPAVGSEEIDYLRAKQQILLLKADRSDLGHFLRPNHPKMVALAEEIARRERLLEIYRQQSADQLQTRKSSLALQIDTSEKEVRLWDAQNLVISRKTAEYQKLKSNSARTQALYDRLLATMQTLDVNKEISPESVTIMEKASPALPAQLKLAKTMSIGLLASLGLSLLTLIVIARLDDRLNSLTELRDLFDEEVLGQVPRQPQPNGDGTLSLLSLDDERHSFLEAYRNLRSSLLYLGQGQDQPKLLLFTSSVPEEGKSLTAANLAILLADAGARVLLVDADLRRGLLHSRFGFAMGPGLSEVLSQQEPWRSLLLKTHTPNLWLLPRGAVTHRSSELFVGNTTTQFLQEATLDYDYVLLDTAPVMAADDVTSLAPHADATLFVIRAEYTSARVARAALDLLYQRHVRVLGLVFNGVRRNALDYYLYKYHDYYIPPGDAKRQIERQHA